MRFLVLALLLSPLIASASPGSATLTISGTVPVTAEMQIASGVQPILVATSSDIKSEIAERGEQNIFRIVAP